jgi:hypothetical protein
MFELTGFDDKPSSELHILLLEILIRVIVIFRIA